MLRCLHIPLFALGLATLANPVQGASERYQPRQDIARVPRQPYTRYFTRDRFDREITFYVSEPASEPAPLPLVVYVQGSGCSSLFAKQGEVIAPSLGHIAVQEAAAGKARVLIVEKPGVAFLDRPASCEGVAEFNRELTLERWAEAIEAAVRAAVTIPGVRPSGVRVIGHSEGGLVACRVARDLPEVVSHVAVMAAGGPSQLFDLMTLARKGNFFRDVSDRPDARAAYVLDQWRKIQADRSSDRKFFFGFAYRRWSTFLASSPIEELSQVRTRIYVAQGTEDQAVDPASADALVAQLRARGLDPAYDRVEGADHSFDLRGKAGTDGWREVIGRIVGWFAGA